MVTEITQYRSLMTFYQRGQKLPHHKKYKEDRCGNHHSHNRPGDCRLNIGSFNFWVLPSTSSSRSFHSAVFPILLSNPPRYKNWWCWDAYKISYPMMMTGMMRKNPGIPNVRFSISLGTPRLSANSVKPIALNPTGKRESCIGWQPQRESWPGC